MYREPATMPLATIEPVKPGGLMRANGSNCTCKPPGQIWCWWHGVVRGDRWACLHGGCWIRAYDIMPMFFNHYWAPSAPSSSDPGGRT